MRREQRGFSILELLIVVGIIGIIAAIAIPNLLDAVSRAKQKRTIGDMRTIATAWEAHATDHSRYNSPAALDVIDSCDETIEYTALQAALVPTYTKSLPERDGWGTPFRLQADEDMDSDAPASAYLIWAAGRDLTFTASAEDEGGATTSFDSDILFADGAFVQYPEGAQTQ